MKMPTISLLKWQRPHLLVAKVGALLYPALDI